MLPRRRGNCQKPSSSCVLRLVVEDRVHAGLTTLTSKFALYFAKVNWVHDNDIIRAIFAQKCRRHYSLPGPRKKFADAVRIDVDHMLDLVVQPERRKKRDGLRSGAPQNRALLGSRTPHGCAPLRQQSCRTSG